MKGAEAIWALAMPVALLVACAIFMRIRRRTADFAEVQAYKARLPAWVSWIERLTWYFASAALVVALSKVFGDLHAALKPGHKIEGADAVYAVVGVGLIALPAAMILANCVSWLVTPMRAANLAAMAGLHQSFGKSNRGLLLAGAVMLPIGLLDLAIAIVEPWAR